MISNFIHIKRLMLTTAFLLIGFLVFSQPLPPEPEGGNKVPVSGAIVLLIAAIAGIGVWKLSKKEKK